MMMKLQITNEIVSCLVSSGLNEKTMKLMKAKPKEFLQNLLNTTLAHDMQVQMVENTKNTIHLSLPYYAQVDEINRLRNSYFYKFLNHIRMLFIKAKIIA